VVIRIDRSTPEGEGLKVQASLVDDTDPGTPVTICSTTLHFDAETTEVAAIVQIQKDLNTKATHGRKISALAEILPEGKTFPPKTEAETKAFLGL
jgi:hypothetical protein